MDHKTNPKALLACLALIAGIAGGLKADARQAARPAANKAVSVDQLAARPNAHLGRVTLVGVVASVSPRKGFLLIDAKEYKECGLKCVNEAGTKKVPVQWSGAAPKTKQAVKVEGVMAKAPKGMTFTANKIAKL